MYIDVVYGADQVSRWLQHLPLQQQQIQVRMLFVHAVCACDVHRFDSSVDPICAAAAVAKNTAAEPAVAATTSAAGGAGALECCACM